MAISWLAKCPKCRGLRLREPRFEARRRKIEKGAQLQRQQSLARIDEIDRPGRKGVPERRTPLVRGKVLAKGKNRRSSEPPFLRGKWVPLIQARATRISFCAGHFLCEDLLTTSFA